MLKRSSAQSSYTEAIHSAELEEKPLVDDADPDFENPVKDLEAEVLCAFAEKEDQLLDEKLQLMIAVTNGERRLVNLLGRVFNRPLPVRFIRSVPASKQAEE